MWFGDSDDETDAADATLSVPTELQTKTAATPQNVTSCSNDWSFARSGFDFEATCDSDQCDNDEQPAATMQLARRTACRIVHEPCASTTIEGEGNSSLFDYQTSESDGSDEDAPPSVSETEESEGSMDEHESEPGRQNERRRASTKSVEQKNGKLWTRAQFPEGNKGHCCWDWSNIQAAQKWKCPCVDRYSCIGIDRLKPEELLFHRKEFLTRVAGHEGGRRDSTRIRLAAHYNQRTGCFSRSFVVGPLNDCCAASCGLADGLSWNTWARARTDLRKNRPMRSGRWHLVLHA